VVKTFNAAAEKMLGYHAEEVIEKATPHLWTESKPNGGLPKRLGMETWLALAGLASLGEYEATFIRKGGQRVPVLVSTTALVDDQGNLTGFLAVIRDLSERLVLATGASKT
jgi:PAS domain S-box-containing protein